MNISVPSAQALSMDAGRHPDLLETMVMALDGGAIEERVAAPVGSLDASPSSWLGAVIEHAATLTLLGRGEYSAVLTFTRARTHGQVLVVTRTNVVEAATRCGQRAIAIEAVEAVADRVAREVSGPGHGLLARCRALVDESEHADESYLEAIERLEACRCALETARSRLVYGEWLRRARRRTEAREQLRAAQQVFSTMGARTLAARARSELEATSERARRRSVDTINDLTPQETQIARLAADGRTNGEIAASLFLSTSTVDYHLRKVFRKLAVRSRRQLRLALGTGGHVVAATADALCSA